MKPIKNQREFSASQDLDGVEFGISLENSAHIMTILRDTLYSDKIKAVLREYSANAWDAHRMAGKASVPISITLPTTREPILKIRDFGAGLSKSDVYNVYTQYGASTKRDDNKVVGMLGIGSKSGFAYSDSFMISSYHDGVCSTYIATIDDSEKGVVSLFSEEPCGDETGVCIQINVNESEIRDFTVKASQLFTFFDPPPQINLALKKIPSPLFTLDKDKIYLTGSHHHSYSSQANHLDFFTPNEKWIAVMGCIPYRVNIEQIKNYKIGLPKFVDYFSGILYFDVGQVDVSASREELKYSDHTKDILLEKINSIFEQYIKTSLELLNNSSNQWKQRLIAKKLFIVREALPTFAANLLSEYVEIELNKDKTIKKFPSIKVCYPDHDSYGYRYSAKSVVSISVFDETKLYIKDTNKSIKGFTTLNKNLVLTPAKGFTDKQFDSELKKFLNAFSLEGIPTVNLSTIAWTAPTNNSSISKDIYSKKVFLLKDQYWSEFPASSNWEPTTNTPTKDDLFLEIENFCPTQIEGVEIRNTCLLFEKLGLKIPKIYGFKTTKKVKASPIGICFLQWREDSLKEIYKKHEDIFNVLALSKVICGNTSDLLHNGVFHEKKLKDILFKIEKSLTKEHLFYKTLQSLNSAKLFDKKLLASATTMLATLDTHKFRNKFECFKTANKIRSDFEKYPMLYLHTGLHNLMYWLEQNNDKNYDSCVEYIKLIDNKEKILC